MGYQPIIPPITYRETHTWHRYDRKFAIFPVNCRDNILIWCRPYYKKYLVYSYKEILDVSYFQYNMISEDVIIEKLTGGS